MIGHPRPTTEIVMVAAVNRIIHTWNTTIEARYKIGNKHIRLPYPAAIESALYGLPDSGVLILPTYIVLALANTSVIPIAFV